MSLNFGSSSALSFRPPACDVEWDGVSLAKATFELACVETAATHAVTAYAVFTHTGSVTVNFDNGGQQTVRWQRGDRYFTAGGNTAVEKTYSPDVSLPITASGSQVTILFSAIQDTSFTYAYKLQGTKGTATRLLLTGKVQPKPLDPFLPSGNTISLVSGVTASGCYS